MQLVGIQIYNLDIARIKNQRNEILINNIYEVGKYLRDKNSIPITITSQLMIFNKNSVVGRVSVVGTATR